MLSVYLSRIISSTHSCHRWQEQRAHLCAGVRLGVVCHSIFAALEAGQTFGICAPGGAVHPELCDTAASIPDGVVGLVDEVLVSKSTTDDAELMQARSAGTLMYSAQDTRPEGECVIMTLYRKFEDAINEHGGGRPLPVLSVSIGLLTVNCCRKRHCLRRC